MYERFTDRARRVVVLAQDDARDLNHNYIGTEHLLLGLIHEDGGIAHQVLTDLGHTYESVKAEVQSRIPDGDKRATGHLPFTPRAKKVLEFSLREALQLGHNYIGTEHLLLGLVREGEGVGAQVVGELPRIRKAVIVKLSKYVKPDPAPEDETAIQKLLSDDRFRGSALILPAIREAYEHGLRDAHPEEVHVVLKGISARPEENAPWLAKRAGISYDNLQVYEVQGDPNSVAVGRFKASLRKFLGVD